MEAQCITPQNFQELFPEFLRELHDASYIAVDLEFTGIDVDSSTDFLRLPEEAFRAKIEAAQRFSPMQIGFAIFRGDSGFENEFSGRPATTARSASESYRSKMMQEAGMFRPVEATTQFLGPLLGSIAFKGTVTHADLEQMQKMQHELECVSLCPTGNTDIYDRLRLYNALDEIAEAIALAKRWEQHIASSYRHMSVSTYSCYLFPESCEYEKECFVTLSCRAVEFLRKNDMDLNRWVSDGLRFVPLSEYDRARSLALHTTSHLLPESEIMTKMKPLKHWIQESVTPNMQSLFFSKYNCIKKFLLEAKIGDSMDLRLPFIKQPLNTEFEHVLRSMGLRYKQRVLTKVSSTGGVENTCILKDPRYFGTRLLSALLTATRGKLKPLILHNGFSDLVFLCCAMHRNPPQTLKGFKRVIRDMFPVFYDTRTLACSPSLQYIHNMNGTMLRTYKQLYMQNRKVQLSFTKKSNPVAEAELKDHDAASDAFMTGALFAYLQEELAQADADFRRLRGITPVYGCIFSVNFEDDDADCIVQPPLALVYLVSQKSHGLIPADSLRERLSPVARNIAFLYNNDYCLIRILDYDITLERQRLIDSSLMKWCEMLSLKVTRVDVESRIHSCGIVYVSELQDFEELRANSR